MKFAIDHGTISLMIKAEINHKELLIKTHYLPFSVSFSVVVGATTLIVPSLSEIPRWLFCLRFQRGQVSGAVTGGLKGPDVPAAL